MSTTTAFDTLLQVSAHALAETVLALDAPADYLARTPLFGAADAPSETQAAAQTLVSNAGAGSDSAAAEPMRAALVRTARARAAHAITAYDSDDDLVLAPAEARAFAAAELAAVCTPADGAELLAACARAAAGPGALAVVGADAVALALLVLATAFLAASDRHAPATPVALADATDELHTVCAEAASLAPAAAPHQDVVYGDADADPLGNAASAAPPASSPVAISSSSSSGAAASAASAMASTPLSTPVGIAASAGASAAAAAAKNEEAEELRLQLTVARDLVEAHERTIAELRAAAADAARAKELAAAEHARTRQELAAAEADAAALRTQLATARAQLSDSLATSARQRQEHEATLERLKQRLSLRCRVTLEDLLLGADDDAVTTAQLFTAPAADESSGSGAAGSGSGSGSGAAGAKERERYEQVVAELTAANQRLARERAQEEREAKKTAAELRAAIADLQFRLDHAASESHAREAAAAAAAATGRAAAPLFAREKPEVQVVTQQVVVRDPQDEARVRALEEQRAQEKAMYLKHIDELDAQLRQLREDSQHRLDALRADYDAQIDALRTQLAERPTPAAPAPAAPAPAPVPAVDTAQVCAEERKRVLGEAAEALNRVLARAQYAAALPVRPIDVARADLGVAALADKMQEVAEICRGLHERAEGGGAGADLAGGRRSHAYENALLREENERLRKDARELQRRCDALVQRGSRERTLELEVQRLELANKQLRIKMYGDGTAAVAAPAKTRRDAADSDSDSEDDDVREDANTLKKGLLNASAEDGDVPGADPAACGMKRWSVILIAVVIGLVCLALGAGAGTLIMKSLSKPSSC